MLSQDSQSSIRQDNHLERKKLYSFQHLPTAKFPGFHDKTLQDALFQWGMKDHLYLAKFSYDQFFQPYQIDSFLLDFLNDGQVQGCFKVLGLKDSWGSLGSVTQFEKEEMCHSITSLDFFDRLQDHGIIRQSKEIVKCLDEYYDSFIVSDELRKCLLMEEFPCFDVFSKADRQEFIFHVFKALCLGGRLCQYEDSIDPYLDATKKLYKDMISVVKDKQTGKLKVASLVYKLKSVISSRSPLFPMDHPQNVCYISIDPLKRHVNVMYHASDAYY